MTTPRGDTVLAGRDIASEQAAMKRLAVQLSAGSFAMLACGWFIGWLIIGRALRPIGAISKTAAEISGGDLSKRIPESGGANELGQLTGVLNSTFARLDESFQQQARFTSDAAHELRTPVTVLLTHAQSTLNRERSPQEYREAFDVVVRTAQRMRRLIESLLELARLDAKQEPLRRENIDLAMIAAESVELLRPLADEKKVTLKTGLPETLCNADPDQIAQVITNLIANAIHYNREGGHVSVKLSREEKSVTLTIADTGVGISADDLPHIFERFYRADKARSRSEGHTGLGLAIVKSIVDAHGGNIAAQSEPGQGSQFRVELPAN